ncbi:aromatic-ring-hydroxylating dioxygenase subunit beta [Paraburkholderia sp. ZP32-5]|uniref:aromatic-ring-hydroxylating dioxygenase subunit beta n=1 Tax=Paraburkholderia sp. ZP32-5 TaxID=2883245 RepID=UPI001F3BB2A5|nr:nuclear transport factor 2 family protein [Paraburkholderia sp. ZP32-5]
MSTLTQQPVQTVSADVRFGIMDLYAAYTAALDEARYKDWAECFTANAEYRLTTKENHERGLPIGIIYCDGKGMIEDRAFTTSETTIAQPRSLRHIVSGMSIKADGDGYIVGSEFLILQTMLDRMTEIVMSGRYIDRVVLDGDRLLFASRICVTDTLLYPTSVVAPV